MQHKADGYILFRIEPDGRCAMTSLLGASDPTGPQSGRGSLRATTYGQVKDTRALNALKALCAAPISMGRGEIPVELRPEEVPSAASSRPFFASFNQHRPLERGTLHYNQEVLYFMNTNDIPIWEKYTLTIEEASKYFRIGEKKLRKLAEDNPDAGWLIMNGNRLQIKRKQFEKVIDSLEVI